MDGRRRVGLFMYGLSGGGVPRRVITLANALAERGWRVDLLVVDASGDLRSRVSSQVHVTEVAGRFSRLPFIRTKRRRQFAMAVRPLARWLVREAPDLLFSADNYANLSAVAAAEAAGNGVPVVVSQRNNTTAYAGRKPALISQIRGSYSKAAAIVAISQGVADDLVSLGLPAQSITTIYNPVVDQNLEEAARQPISHPWFGDPSRPLILAAGRLGPQKDFPTLLRAFALLKERGSSARLVILGEGKTPAARNELRALAEGLGIGGEVDLPGFAPDAVPYIAKADLFVMSSAWEGLGNVLVEALACGVPAVSTDCPSGPAEILDGGRVGPLVPVGDADALSRAIEARLAAPRDVATLKGQAQLFTTEEAATRYVALFERVIAARESPA
jgi:glycosyltransferase involved in cell wall biosynthesis